MKVIRTAWRGVFHIFLDPPYSTRSKSQNKLFTLAHIKRKLIFVDI